MRTETILVAGGLAIVVGGTLLWSAFGGDANRSAEESVVMIAPPADPETDAPATGALPSPEASPNYVPVTGPAEYMMTTRQTSIQGSPSATSPVLYAFPAGRRLKVVGREAGFARIEDLQSKATGWVDERLLAPSSATASVKPSAPPPPSDAAEPAPAPPRPPAVAAKPPSPKPAAPKAVAAPPKPQVTTEADAAAKKQAAAKRAQQQRAENEKKGGFPGFLNRAFGGR